MVELWRENWLKIALRISRHRKICRQLTQSSASGGLSDLSITKNILSTCYYTFLCFILARWSKKCNCIFGPDAWAYHGIGWVLGICATIHLFANARIKPANDLGLRANRGKRA